MSNNYALDLRVARRKSGLTQADCGHLLGSTKSKTSRLENGKTRPSAADIAILSIVYGRSYNAFCPTAFETAARQISERLLTLPTPTGSWLGRFNRTNTLDNLDARLDHIISTTNEPD